MNEDYLWDKSGPPDPEVVHLEQLLGPFRHQQKPPVRRIPKALGWLAAAAVLTAAIAIPLSRRGQITDWNYSAAGMEARAVRTGQVIDTEGKNEAKLESSLTGELKIEPKSRLRLVASAENQQRFQLERGTIHAFIWAPPGKFVVDTPAARTVDLGCRYTLQTEEDGTGLLSVDMGWVAFEWKGTESFIPAGAACKTKPNSGPGTPWFTDASPELRRALERFDAAPGADTLNAALELARPRDAMTVWHLMTRTKSKERTHSWETLAKLVPLPPAANKDGILRGDTAAVDAAWDALDLGSAQTWRNWKKNW
jgi:hypothetical protein